MALVCVARFHTLSEAEVAASVLRSAGLEPVVFDEFYGRMWWIQQAALGGYRLMVAGADLADARALLADLPVPEPLAAEDAIERSSGGATGALAVAATLMAGPEVGWALAGTRRPRSGGWRRVTAAILLLGTLAFWLAYMAWTYSGRP